MELPEVLFTNHVSVPVLHEPVSDTDAPRHIELALVLIEGVVGNGFIVTVIGVVAEL